jgi:two-component system, OmpR family, phosphate regulon sensor histidine kinase PhoR
LNRKPIRNIIILGVISIIGIIITQAYWFRKALDIKENQFNQSVNIALRNVASEILMQRGDTSYYIEPINQPADNFFVVSVNDTLHPYLLESLLKAEFSSRNINLDFEYVIYDCFTDSVVYGKTIKLNSSGDNYKETNQAIPIKWDKDGHYFGVYFPSKSAGLVSQSGIWMFSSAILLVVCVFFAYSLWIIIQQRKMSEITTDFINNITHEFKTPISTIAISADTLQHPQIKDFPEKIKRYTSIIANENLRLKKMVDYLLQMSVLEKVDYELDISRQNLENIIKDLVERFSIITEEKNGKIIFNNHTSESEIKCDAIHLSNAISNIIDNAIKYNNNSPIITIELKETLKNKFSIIINDNGIGLNKKEIKLIFNRFYRVPKGNIHTIKGFGLGLNYVQSIIKKHQGQIKVESEIGKGSTFEILLPKNL